MLPKIKVNIYNIHDDFYHVKREWCELCQTANPSFFLSWMWVENWIKTLPEKISVFLLIFKGGNIPKTGFFVGVPSPHFTNFFLSRLYLNTTGVQSFDKIYIEYNSILVEGDSHVPMEEIVTVFPFAWDEFIMPGLKPQFYNFDSLSNAYNVSVNKVVSPYVDLAKVRENKLDFLGLLSNNTRAQIRRSYRSYQKLGDLSFQVASIPRQAMEILSELKYHHQETWKIRGQLGCFSNNYFTKFHKRFVEKYFENGNIQLAKLCCGNDVIGCLYNFISDNSIYFYQSGFAAVNDNKYKPGLMIHSEAICYNAKKGVDIYDFLAGSSQYKKSLSTDEREMYWVKLQKKKLNVFVYNYAKKLYGKFKNF